MATIAFHTELVVPVAGGPLTVAVAGPGEPGAAPLVLGVHGITGSHRSLAVPARHLAARDITFLAPDLRGRGASAGLPGPYGLDAHVADLMAVLGYWGAERAVLTGHSMGAYIVARLAAAHPGRSAGVVLVDGGLPLPVAPGTDTGAALEAVLGPALARLRMEFASPADYRDFWRRHPAFADRWSPDVESYVDYDLDGPLGALRSKVVESAVRADGRDLLDSAAAGKAVAAVPAPVVLLRAPRGLADEPCPLLSEAMVDEARRAVPGMRDVLVADTNHYLIVLGTREAAAVAAEIARVTASVGPHAVDSAPSTSLSGNVNGAPDAGRGLAPTTDGNRRQESGWR
ncbi:MAG: alpha/beta hydrolase [Pseudonocardiales bacterium]|nr:alpha/beta hydrolase [Pseudonocardiales bacterium]MBV9030990.1 alpha/beta hydrolase [Pseudonocardiales bacterium]MBW0009994.1 alpha/beta hydrolase [Pseudonocardiales bacterium]